MRRLGFAERQPPPVLAARLHASRLAACAAQWLEQEEHHGKRSEAGGRGFRNSRTSPFDGWQTDRSEASPEDEG